jgi:hypothetical protein
MEPKVRQSPINIAVAALTFSIPSLATAQQLDIVQIMGQFVQAGYATSRCAKPDQRTLSNYLANFKLVTFRAMEELKKRNPSQTEQEIADGLKQRTGAVEKAIDETIRTNGCNDPRIQDLLKRFEMQASLQF